MVAKSPELSLIPAWQPFMGGALAPVVVSANCVHLRVWEVGREIFPLNLCDLVWPRLARGHLLTLCGPDRNNHSFIHSGPTVGSVVQIVQRVGNRIS